MTQITFTLERLIGGAVLLLMLALAALTFGVPTRAESAPIIIMEQRSPQRVSMPQEPPPAAAKPTPALVMPAAIQPEPTTEPPTPVVIVAVESPPPAAPAPVAAVPMPLPATYAPMPPGETTAQPAPPPAPPPAPEKGGKPNRRASPPDRHGPGDAPPEATGP